MVASTGGSRVGSRFNRRFSYTRPGLNRVKIEMEDKFEKLGTKEMEGDSASK